MPKTETGPANESDPGDAGMRHCFSHINVAQGFSTWGLCTADMGSQPY